MGRQIVWLTGLSGAGKTFTADYLSAEHDFLHIDGDRAFFTGDATDKKNTGDLVQAFQGWFKGEECEQALWEPYLHQICTRTVEAALEHPERNIVIAFSNYRTNTRDYCRNTITQMLRDNNDTSPFKYVQLFVSERGFAERQVARFETYSKIQGWTMKHFWEEVRQAKEPFVDRETCIAYMMADKESELSGFQDLDLTAHPEDAVIDTSDAHKGVLEKLHANLSLGEVAKDVYATTFVDGIAAIQLDRVEAGKKILEEVGNELNANEKRRKDEAEAEAEAEQKK